MSDAMTINLQAVQKIMQNLNQASAPDMPHGAWYPRRDDDIQKHIALYFNDRDNPEWDLSKEDMTDPDLVFSPEQAMYAIVTFSAYQIKDESETIDRKNDYKNSQQWIDYNQHIDNTMGWLLRNAPDHMVAVWARTALAIFRVTFDPTSMKNWDEFADRYQDLILPKAL